MRISNPGNSQPLFLFPTGISSYSFIWPCVLLAERALERTLNPRLVLGITPWPLQSAPRARLRGTCRCMSTLGAENLYSFPKKPFSNEIWRRAATDAPCRSEPGIQIKAALQKRNRSIIAAPLTLAGVSSLGRSVPRW